MIDATYEKKGLVTEVSEQFGAVFRFLLPGVLAVSIAASAHPAWFVKFQTTSWQHITLGAVLATTVGNTLLALNRYGPHQLFDFLAFLCGHQGPARDGNETYSHGLARHVQCSLSITGLPPLARQHIQFRASAVLLLYTLAELLCAAAIWNESDSFAATHVCLFAVLSAVSLVVAFWQHLLTRAIDAAIFGTSGAAPANTKRL
jgi:hypothetical protein